MPGIIPRRLAARAVKLRNMKGNPKVIAALNEALKAELTSINQYFLHAEMCENWHFSRLGNVFKKKSIDEMKHAEALIERIFFFDATPNLTLEIDDVRLQEDCASITEGRHRLGSKGVLRIVLDRNAEALRGRLQKIAIAGRALCIELEIPDAALT